MINSWGRKFIFPSVWSIVKAKSSVYQTYMKWPLRQRKPWQWFFTFTPEIFNFWSWTAIIIFKRYKSYFFSKSLKIPSYTLDRHLKMWIGINYHWFLLPGSFSTKIYFHYFYGSVQKLQIHSNIIAYLKR